MTCFKHHRKIRFFYVSLFLLVCINLGPLLVTTKGNKYVVTLADYGLKLNLSVTRKWPEAESFPDKEVAKLNLSLTRKWPKAKSFPDKEVA